MLLSSQKKKKKQISKWESHATCPHSPQNNMKFSFNTFKLGSISVTCVVYHLVVEGIQLCSLSDCSGLFALYMESEGTCLSLALLVP